MRHEDTAIAGEADQISGNLPHSSHRQLLLVDDSGSLVKKIEHALALQA